MIYKGYVITQALAKKFQGIKSLDVPSAGLLFMTEGEAYNHLFAVVLRRKKEIDLGIRNKDNLNPDSGLDFCVEEATLEIPEKKMLSRGWVLNQNT